MKKLMADVADFYDKVLLLARRNSIPGRISPTRKTFACVAFREEVNEYENAQSLSEEIDALLDLQYFLVGRFLEHGVSPCVFMRLWTNLQQVNMAKERKSTPRGKVDAKRRINAAHTDFGWLAHLRVMKPFIAAAEVSYRKQRDYGSFRGYFPFGEKSAVQMLFLKVRRLVTLLNRAGPPRNESKMQNTVDLVNYAAAYFELLKRARWAGGAATEPARNAKKCAQVPVGAAGRHGGVPSMPFKAPINRGPSCDAKHRGKS